MSRWTEEQVKELKYHYSVETPVPEIARLMSMKPQRIKAKASKLGITRKYRYEFSDFVENFRKVHEAGKYEYAEQEIEGSLSIIRIWCNDCAAFFEQRIKEHAQGKGCAVCAQRSRTEKQTGTFESFVNSARGVHGDTYEYFEPYVSSRENIKIKCREHGVFWQIPNTHLSGSGCPECARTRLSELRLLTRSEFIERARAVHGDVYDYGLVEYRGMRERVIIVCPVHGEFAQEAGVHVHGEAGCPACRVSPLHSSLISFLTEAGVSFDVNNREVLGGRELDIFIPDAKLAVEVNGAWHHRLDNVGSRSYHDDKFKECESLGIELLQFWDVDLRHRRDITRSMVLAKLGRLPNRVFARKCAVRELDSSIFAEFLEANHIQGRAGARHRYGLFCGEDLVAVMGFSVVGGEVNLVRFCSLVGHSVVGGFSKLFKHTLRVHGWGRVVSFSDGMYSSGAVYKSHGFELDGENPPRLYYTDGRGIFNRRNFQKKRMLKRFPDLGVGMQEKEMARVKGYFQLYGCGTRRWVYESGGVL